MIKVHAGCGKNYLEGWVNCDFSDRCKIDERWDLLQDAPFVSESVDFIFTEHVLEHFTLKDGISILKKFYNILKPGGKLRVVVPSLESLIEGYLNDENFLEINNLNFPNNKLAFNAQLINKTFYSFGHKNMYDKQLLTFALRSSGFDHKSLKYFNDDNVGDLAFEGVGRRVYKINSSVKNLSVEVIKNVEE